MSSNEHTTMHDYQEIILGYHANKVHHGTSLKDRVKKKLTWILLLSENVNGGLIFQFVVINPEVDHSFLLARILKFPFVPAESFIAWQIAVQSLSHMKYDYNQTKLLTVETKRVESSVSAVQLTREAGQIKNVVWS